MTSALGSRIKTIFVDEFHDLYAPHPDRQQVWNDACHSISKISKQRAFVSATHPPHLSEVFFRKAHINSDYPIHAIRASTDRPNLAYYILTLSLSESTTEKPLWQSTTSLVRHLVKLLAPDERILVFFGTCELVDTFSRDTGCAVYHSKLPIDGDNTKAHNLDRWDTGDSLVMAATTAAGQGVDRPHIKFVLIHGHTFGMLAYAQQGGRGGRGGRPSYVILLRKAHVARRTPSLKEGDVKCVGQFLDYAANKDVCRRKALLAVMDGEGGALGCLDKPGCNLCDVCDPDSDMLKIVSAAVASSPERLDDTVDMDELDTLDSYSVTATDPRPKVTHSKQAEPGASVGEGGLSWLTPLTLKRVGGKQFEKVRDF